MRRRLRHLACLGLLALAGPLQAQEKLLIPDGGSGAAFGQVVALADNGDTAIVSAHFDDTAAGERAGSAHVFVKNEDGTWSHQAQLLAPDAAADDRFGSAVALSGSGDLAIVSAPLHDAVADDNAGAVYIFTRTGDTWSYAQQLVAPDAAANDYFGTAVALSTSGTTALVGAELDDTALADNTGSAYIFTESGGSWTHQEQLLAPDGSWGDRFGGAVALSASGDTALVGADSHGTLAEGANVGAAHVFTRSGDSWSHQQELSDPEGVSDGFFGKAVALSASGDLAIIGSPGDTNLGGVAVGAAHVFARSAGSWSHEEQLLDPVGHADDEFGSAVTLSGSGASAAIGAPADDWELVDLRAGSVQVYARSELGSWTHARELFAPDHDTFDNFGGSVSLAADNDTLLVGSGANAAYVLRDNCPATSNPEQLDNDGDEQGDACDDDDDDDGVPDVSDALPFDASESVDTDGDGVGNNADTDDDNDGLLDTAETNTGTFTSQYDTGTNPLTLDSDGDGWDDGTEVDFGTDPTDAASSLDPSSGKLLIPDGGSGAAFGQVVALADNGDTAIVSAHFDDTAAGERAGSAHVFVKNEDGTWSHQAQLLAPDAAADDRFGSAVALSGSGDLAIVSAPLHDAVADDNAGAVYIFTRTGDTWSYAQQLVAPDAAANDYFGTAVALSTSGTTALVGAELDDTALADNTGSAYIFTESGGSWTHQEQLLAPDGSWGDRFGGAVALSASGDTALVGADSHGTLAEGANVGAAHVFTRSGDSWSHQQELSDPEGVSDGFFGKAVALSASGDLAIIGSPGDTNLGGVAVGAAHVFARSAGSWSHEEQLLDPVGHADDEFGSAVTLSGSGASAAIGAPADDWELVDLRAGSVQVYARSELGSWTHARELFAPDHDTFDNFGGSVSLAADNDTLLVGSVAGAPYVFDFADSDGDGVPDDLDAFPLDPAESVDTDGDGVGNNADTDDDNDGLLDTAETNTGAFTSQYDTGTNPLTLDSDGDGWDDGTEVEFGTDPTDPASSLAANGRQLLAWDGESGDWFGYVADFDDSGDTAIVGAYRDDTDAGLRAGSAYVFMKNEAGAWSHQAQLLAPDGQANDEFGTAVALAGAGDLAIVGVPYDDTAAGNNAGSAYVFTRSGDEWTFQQQLHAPAPVTIDYFGKSVALSSDGNVALIGVSGNDSGENNAGSAEIFTRSGGIFSHQAQLLAPDAAPYDSFGSSVSISSAGDTAAVGASSDDTPAGNNTGSVSIFTHIGDSWNHQQQLLAPDAEEGDAFGRVIELSASGDTMVVGASSDSTAAGDHAGSAHVFARTGGTWSHQAHLLAPDGEGGDYFGNSVTLSGSGDLALIGAYYDDTAAGDYAGSVHRFARSDGTWNHTHQLLAPDAEGNSGFGSAVALSASGNSELITRSGAAYVFDLTDTDEDGAFDATDNCPDTANADQADLDDDNVGDACDDDRDGDGAANAFDAFPDDVAATTDTDGDGQPDALTGPSSTGLVEDTDDDNDGLLDTAETNSGIFQGSSNSGTDPLALDSDADGWDDGTEVEFGTDPTDPASRLDATTRKLLAPDGAQSDSFGFAVALSASADTAVVGSYLDDTAPGADAGSAHIFKKSGAVWSHTQQLQAPNGAAADNFGYAVALSSSGETALVSAYRDDTADADDAGSVHVFTWNGDEFVHQQQLTAPGAEFNDRLGGALALSSSGDIALIAAFYDDTAAGSNSGSLHIFTRSGVNWSHTQQLEAPDAAATDFFGYAVALSSSGDTLIAGAHFDDTTGGTNAGSAHVFTRVGDTWIHQQQLLAPDGSINDRFGAALALSAPGDAVIIGAYGDDTSSATNAGSAHVFTRTAGLWSHQQQLLAPAGEANDDFGKSVALSSAADIAVVGAYRDDTEAGINVGSAHVFARSGDDWSHVHELLASDAADNDHLGRSIGISFSGKTVLLGAYRDSTAAGDYAGSAYAFDIPDSDSDGLLDFFDNCPNDPNGDQVNTDGDSEGDACDLDDDDDGVPDTSDAFPLDPQESADADGDLVGDNEDNCPLVANADQGNLDDDTAGDVCDEDRDGDGVANLTDAFPDDGAATTDTDDDGMPDSLFGTSDTGLIEDSDDDGDGLLDTVETGTGEFTDENDTGTDSLNDDTDGDGFADGIEVAAESDPTNPESIPGSEGVPSLAPLPIALLGGLIGLLGVARLTRVDGRRR